jgi:hypothetical protein
MERLKECPTPVQGMTKRIRERRRRMEMWKKRLGSQTGDRKESKTNENETLREREARV